MKLNLLLINWFDLTCTNAYFSSVDSSNLCFTVYEEVIELL